MPTSYSESQIWESEETKSKLRAPKEWGPGPPATLTATLPTGWTVPRTRVHGLWAGRVSCPPALSRPQWMLWSSTHTARLHTIALASRKPLDPQGLIEAASSTSRYSTCTCAMVDDSRIVRMAQWHRWEFEMVALVRRPFKMIATITTCSPELLPQAGVTPTHLVPCQPWSPTEV